MDSTERTPVFSVLLPTRNRLDLAKGAIETVRAQAFQDWEIVLSDNCSEEDVAGYVRTLNDPRIVYLRSDHFLAVTDNWNRAIDASRGRYVVMLGDDDGLTPGYFDRVLETMARLEEPDFLYHGAYHFAFPGAMPNAPDGRLTDVTLFHGILRGLTGPAVLPVAEARRVGAAALDMWALYGFNMQYFVFSRRFLNRMRDFGAIYQGPFPDFYAANMAMLLAEKVGLLAEPMVIIGISPKSYGFHHFNKREKTGIDFLQGAEGPYGAAPPALRARLLPGTNMNTSWLISVALIPGKFPDRTDLPVSIGRYRRLQIADNLRAQGMGEPVEAGLGEMWPLLTWNERLFALGVWLWVFACRVPRRFAPRYGNYALSKLAVRHLAPPRNGPPAVDGKYRSMMEVFAGLAAPR